MFVVRVLGREVFAAGRPDAPEAPERLGCQDLGVALVVTAEHNGEDYTPPARVGF